MTSNYGVCVMKQLIAATFLFLLVGCGKSSSDTAHDAIASYTPPRNTSERARAAVKQWMEDAKRGDYHLTQWCNWTGTEAYGGKPTVHAVRSYDIKSVTVGAGPAGSGWKEISVVRVRVEGSDSEGRHTTKDYAVAVGDTGTQACLLGGR